MCHTSTRRLRAIGRRALTGCRALPRRGNAHRSAPLLLAVVVTALAAASAHACPFCTALAPSFSQRRDAAEVVALGEYLADHDRRQRFAVHQVTKGASLLGAAKDFTAATDFVGKRGALVVLLGTGQGARSLDDLTWQSISVNETSYAYFARAPDLRLPIVERLPYFAPYLEHADPLIARDAYLEFGRASYDEVAQVATYLSADKLRRWLVDERVPPERKGFYGMAIAVASASTGSTAQAAAFLRQLVVAPAGDFRAGFDGILGGYLLAAGEEALRLVDERILANPRSADGDVRHAMTALRFYYEFGHGIPPERLRRSLRHLLARPEFASEAIIDLGRWADWDVLDGIVALYGRDAYPQPATNRAVIGYLLVCPTPAAEVHLERLRQLDPQAVADAEQFFTRFGGPR